MMKIRSCSKRMNARQAKMEQRPRNGTTGSSRLLTDLGKTLMATQLEVFVKQLTKAECFNLIDWADC